MSTIDYGSGTTLHPSPAPDFTNYNVLAKSDYTPPSDIPRLVLGWAIEALQESDFYIRNQPGYGRSKELSRLITGDDRPFREGSLSTTSDNETGRLFGVQSADLTDWKPYWQYESFNADYEQQVRIQSNILTSWFPKYGERATELTVKRALISGASVGNLVWDPNRQDIALNSRHIHDVRPIRPFGDTGSFQDCFAVIDQREMPVNYVKQMFPHASAYIRAERDASVASALNQASARVFRGSPLMMQNQLASLPSSKLGALPVVDLYRLYVDDRSVNESDGDVEMGDWGDAADGSGRRIPLNDWSYTVVPGDPLYPLKRLIIFTREVMLYDGPSNYWHAMFPYAKLCLDTMPDSWFGTSAFWRLIPLQRSLDRLYRAVDDHVAKILHPGKQAPKIGVAASELARFKTNMPGQSVRYGPAGKIEVTEIPDLDPTVLLQIDKILARMAAHVGTQQLMNLASLAGVTEDPKIEQMLATLQPETRSRSRAIEAFQRDVGTIFAYNVAEFYPMGRRVAMLGDDGVTIQDYDIDRYSLIPAYVGSDYDASGRVRPEIHNNPRPRFDRGREFYRQFSLNIKPASMLKSAETTERLLTLTMRRQGDAPLHYTLKKLGFEGVGPAPKGSLIDQITMEKAGLPPAGSTLNAQVLQIAKTVMGNPQLAQLVQVASSDPALVAPLMQVAQAMLQAGGTGGAGDGGGAGGSSVPSGPDSSGGGGGGTPTLPNPGVDTSTNSTSASSSDSFGPHRGPGHPPSASQLPSMRPDGRLEESK